MNAPIEKYINKYYPQGSVTQWFGENPPLYAFLDMDGHNGIDIVAPWGSPIFAVEDGQVIDIKDSPTGFGKHLRIVTPSHNGISREWTYGHNSEHFVSLGDRVKAGQHIANMGNTGFVVSGKTPFWKHNPFAGTHLHLGCRECIVGKGWKYNDHPLTPPIEILNYGNGYKGAIDFRLSLDNLQFNNQTAINSMQLNTISLANKVISLLNILKKTIGIAK